MASAKEQNHRESTAYIGTHVIADFWHCKFNDDAENLLGILINAAHVSDAKILGSIVKQFEPEGATALVLLAESHISAHTWPEYEYIALDIFTCGKNMKPELAIEYLEKQLKPQKTSIKTIHRGISSNG